MDVLHKIGGYLHYLIGASALEALPKQAEQVSP